MTREQIINAFTAIVGFAPREADIQVILHLGATPEVCAEFILDHWMGDERDVVTQDELIGVILRSMQD